MPVKYSRRVAGTAVLLGAFMLGVGVTASATPTDSCEQSYVAPMNSTAKLKAYDDCRFDRIDATLQRLDGSTPEPAPTSTSPAPTSPSPSPTPSPAPTSTATPTFPDADSTGVPAGIVLTPMAGVTVTQAGTVIDGKDITGSVIIRAANVTVKNSRIHGSGGYGCVQTQTGGTVTVEDSEIVGGCENGIVFDDWTARRVDIHGTFGDGVKLGSDVLLEDSWIHDLSNASGLHTDGGQVQTGVTNTTVRHNTIDLGDTAQANAALFLAPDLGPSSDGPLVIEGNRLNGGNFILFCVDGNNGQYFVRNITISGNRFGDRFQYGRARVNVPISQSGNVVDSTGAPFTL